MTAVSAASDPAPILVFEQIGPDAFRLALVAPEAILDRAAVSALGQFIEARLGSAFHRTLKPKEQT